MVYQGVMIGCGHISKDHLWAWKQISDANIVAVCDIVQEKAQERANEFNIPLVFTDYKKMLAEVKPDFVDIATRPSSHSILVTYAAQKGLHVLCQKPLAQTLQEANQLEQICRKAGIVFMVNENGRHQRWFRDIHGLLTNKVIGDPYYARFEERGRVTLPQPDFGGQPYLSEMTRLAVYEMGVHYLDIARYLFGEADWVFAQLNRVSPFIAGEDQALIATKFQELTCLIDIGWYTVPLPSSDVTWGRLKIEGTIGTLSLETDGTLYLFTDHEQQTWRFPHDTLSQSFVATQQHFITCLDTGDEPETSGAQTLNTMKLVYAAYESASLGQVVNVEI